jgi:hypothetical protein
MALHKPGWAHVALPVWTTSSSDPGWQPRRSCFARRTGRRPLTAAVLAPRSVRHRPANRGSIPTWTSSDSAAVAPARTTALAGEGRAVGITRASVVGVEMHTHRDVGVCSIGLDELIAVLLLRHQRGHAVPPPPRLWNGRDPEPSGAAPDGLLDALGFRPTHQPPRRSAVLPQPREGEVPTTLLVSLIPFVDRSSRGAERIAAWRRGRRFCTNVSIDADRGIPLVAPALATAVAMKRSSPRGPGHDSFPSKPIVPRHRAERSLRGKRCWATAGASSDRDDRAVAGAIAQSCAARRTKRQQIAGRRFGGRIVPRRINAPNESSKRDR